MCIVISLQNRTTYVPEIVDIELTGASWLTGQELTDLQPIAAQARVVGAIEPVGTTGVDLRLALRYGYVGRGPGGADVRLHVEAMFIDGTPLVSATHDVLPHGQLTGTEVEVTSEDDGTMYVLLTVQ